MKQGEKILAIVLIIVIIALGIIFAIKIISESKQEPNKVVNEPINNEKQENKEQEEAKKEKTVEVYKGKDRPIAVMIDNSKEAWPQAGLQDAYLVYEIIVEGGETRLMAMFKGVDVDKIGPVRSARHYFLDYVMEHDAIYAHFGQSPQAALDLKKYKIKDINGMSEDGTTFKRVRDKYAPHNAVTSTDKIIKSAENKKYETTSDRASVLNYVTDEVTLNGKEAENVYIPHSDLQDVKYVYNKEKKLYTRYARDMVQKDWDTKKTITTKNIIVQFCNNYTLVDSENKGRQGLYNIGTFDGYYITNGKAEKIKITKNARSSKSVYKDLEGNIIDVNDGNTFINICPKDTKVVIK